MSSGVVTSEDCVAVFNEIKMKKTLKYVIFKLSDDFKKIVVENKREKPAVFQDLVNALPKNEPRYAVYECDTKKADGTGGAKLVLITWVPDGEGGASVKQKMMYSSSKAALKKICDGAKEYQANDASDLNEEEISVRASK